TGVTRDWSSDVCAADLVAPVDRPAGHRVGAWISDRAEGQAVGRALVDARVAGDGDRRGDVLDGDRQVDAVARRPVRIRRADGDGRAGWAIREGAGAAAAGGAVGGVADRAVWAPRWVAR